MTEHRIGTQEEWQAERDALLKEEKQLTREGDELARKRRELPWVRVEKDYRFEAEDDGSSGQVGGHRAGTLPAVRGADRRSG